MSDKIEYSRLLMKRSTVSGDVPTVPPITATTLNDFTPNDIFVGEFFLNAADDLLWIRTDNGILSIDLSGSTGTTIPTLTQVLFEGNNTGGYDIEVSSGNTIVFQGLNTGTTSNLLGIDASGNTIVTTVSGGTTSGDYLPLSGGTITGSTGIFNFNPNVLGGRIEISGNTSLPMYAVTIAPYLTNPSTSVQLGMRTWDSVTNPGYGKVGDAFLYASNETNGLNIINRQTSGSTLEDYIRFYAGADASSVRPDIHIQGSGSTRGYVGFGLDNPTEQVDVAGSVKMGGNLIIGAVGTTASLYNLGIDANGVVVSGTTGGGGGSTTITGVTLFQSGWTFNSPYYEYNYVNAAITGSVQVNFTPYNSSVAEVIISNIYPYIALDYGSNTATITADYQPSTNITGQIVIY
jgi:hypothetical protein